MVLQPWVLGVGLTTLCRKNNFVTKCYKGPRTSTGSLELELEHILDKFQN
jgi:hypothetical protein